MKSLQQRQTEEYKRILATQPKWVPNDAVHYGDGDIDFRAPDEFQWDVPGDRTSYVISHLVAPGSEAWAVCWFTAGPDHGIIADGEVGTFDTASEARAAAYQHAADRIAADLDADARMYGDPDEPTFTVKIPGVVWQQLEDVYALGPHPDDMADRVTFNDMQVEPRRVGRGWQAVVTGTAHQWRRVATYMASLTELYETMTSEELGSDRPQTWRMSVDRITAATGDDYWRA